MFEISSTVDSEVRSIKMISYNLESVLDIIFFNWIVLVLIFGYVIYKWSTATYDTFAKRGLKFVPPVPLFGNFFHVIFQTKNFPDAVRNLYNYYPKAKLVDFFSL